MEGAMLAVDIFFGVDVVDDADEFASQVLTSNQQTYTGRGGTPCAYLLALLDGAPDHYYDITAKLLPHIEPRCVPSVCRVEVGNDHSSDAKLLRLPLLLCHLASHVVKTLLLSALLSAMGDDKVVWFAASGKRCSGLQQTLAET